MINIINSQISSLIQSNVTHCYVARNVAEISQILKSIIENRSRYSEMIDGHDTWVPYVAKTSHFWNELSSEMRNG